MDFVLNFGALVSALNSFLDSLFTDMVPAVLSAIGAHPLLLLFVVAVPLSGIAVGMVKRLMNTN